ncbi:Hok/Gef family protein [Salmonella enterica subsp. enterica]|uniref:Hok/Gef family protein n=1 Tax=Salmonella enterica subsp. enterica serovar Ank TaxID=1173578 RepID=A0A5I2X0F0_SALET|nr:Hok/Gef family protein [Salmonella enterica]EBS1327055.1 Hok/Gef family protein [Salmonella enterica subsp. enterica serovar Muenchen]EBV7249360.1 Hok/Gef family protein [Salmonella enterica subsp. enterica serovar Pomona]EBY9279834.1 Hok/Gef family protein [Salmonella enterica subsp. enterica serovar Denver]ECE0790069.1 Hok/Gef family protein [Salmonella enterica subsp. diarizonae]ECE7748110.1 Hok/Gef family protein [Salmonella enterica subsp. enterica serovar Ngili]ECF1922336.1 Hok/Gef f
MSQKTLSTITICIAVVLVIWMLRGSMCELRFRFAGAEIAAFLQCKE